MRKKIHSHNIDTIVCIIDKIIKFGILYSTLKN